MSVQHRSEQATPERVRLSARVSRTLHRACLLETWRREALGMDGDQLGRLTQIAVTQLPETFEELDALLIHPAVKRALAESTTVQMQPRVSADAAELVRLVARSLSFHGSQLALVTESQVLVAALISLLERTEGAHNPYALERARRSAAGVQALSATLGHSDTTPR